jgi:hypothetical protein
VGRSYHFYARGFCELGEGDVDLESVLTSIDALDLFSPIKAEDRWLVVEQGSTADPLTSAKRSYTWLQDFIAKKTRRASP